MVIKDIEEIINDTIPETKPIKEVMDIYIKDIPEYLSRRNGMIYCIIGSGGSGKTSLLLSMFKNKSLYLKKFHYIYLFQPESSFLSIADHPFKEHDKIYHELNSDILFKIMQELSDRKEELVNKKKKMRYSLIIIDDYADQLKDKHIMQALNKLLIKSRHLCCSFMLLTQGILYVPKILRKQITYSTIFKTNNVEEWKSISRELLHMNYDDSLKLFDFVYDEKYNHLDIDSIENKLYKNFNELKISTI
jgi:hypothetical protein